MLPDYLLKVEPATPHSVEPFGHFIGVHAQAPRFAAWPGAVVQGGWPIEIGSSGEVLHVQLAARRFPTAVELLERHDGHTQTYLGANGKPWVMVMGLATRRDGLPDLAALRAFRFEAGSGIALHAGSWHEFPLALEDDTRFSVILRSQAHINTLASPVHPNDARGPDLERWDIAARATVSVQL
jgi:ureidoglycolate lyase